MAILIDNSTEFTYGMGLVPWYLSGYILPAAGKPTAGAACPEHATVPDECLICVCVCVCVCLCQARRSSNDVPRSCYC